MRVVLLSCVSPPGAELEESNKNMKKLDAMTLIKEGGSQHTLRLGPRADRATFEALSHHVPGGGCSKQQVWGFSLS